MEHIYSQNLYKNAGGKMSKNYYVKNPYSDVDFSVKVQKDDNKIIVVSVYADVMVKGEQFKVHMDSFPTLKGADYAIGYYRACGISMCQEKMELCLTAAKSNGTAGNIQNCFYYSKQATVWAVLKDEKCLAKTYNCG